MSSADRQLASAPELAGRGLVVGGARGGLRWAKVGFAALLAITVLSWCGALSYFFDLTAVPGQQNAIRGLRVVGMKLSGVPLAALPQLVRGQTEQLLDVPVTVVFLPAEAKLSPRKTTRREMGLRVDVDGVVNKASAMGRSGRPFSDYKDRLLALIGQRDISADLTVDRAVAIDYLGGLKDDVDRAPIDARLDLEKHTIADGAPGLLLSVYEALSSVDRAALYGSDKVEISLHTEAPKVQAKDIQNIDIAQVLGTWETRYSAAPTDTDRTYNLKVGASKLNGKILEPHALFSFNEVVGDRTEKEGYRVAPVIASGELIDGLAGGMCQIASTLHGAAFFAGLEIVSSTPHSRPSAYITMGLDSTVVYPSTDLKLRNPYDFPVVMHYTVNQGSVKVELLGKDRPYRVIFEREVKTETPFGAESRSDAQAPEGQKLTLQEGYPGYTLMRRRYVFDKDHVPRWNGEGALDEILKKQKVTPLSRQQWALHYPATAQIVAYGSGPKSLKPKPLPPSHKIPPLNPKDKPFYRMLK